MRKAKTALQREADKQYQALARQYPTSGRVGFMDRIRGAFKGLSMRFTRAYSYYKTIVVGSGYDDVKLQTKMGRAWLNSSVSAVIRYITDTLPEAPIVVQGRNPEGLWETLPPNPFTERLKKPNNERQTSTDLIAGLVVSLTIDSNAYWFLVKSKQTNEVLEMHFVPYFWCEPKPSEDGNKLVEEYIYTVNGTPDPWKPEDVVHFRIGLDPTNPAKGLSRLYPVLAQCLTVKQAAHYALRMLENMGIPFGVYSPKEANARIKPDDVKDIKANIKKQTGDDAQFEPLVLSGPMDAQFPSFSPDDMALEKINTISQADIAAAFGIPPLLLGWLVGLVNATYSNANQFRRLGWEMCIRPFGKRIAETMTLQLLPYFLPFFDAKITAGFTEFRVWFDESQVEVLQEDKNEKHDRARKNYDSGIWMLSEARAETGVKTSDDENYYKPTPTTFNAATNDEKNLAKALAVAGISGNWRARRQVWEQKESLNQEGIETEETEEDDDGNDDNA